MKNSDLINETGVRNMQMKAYFDSLRENTECTYEKCIRKTADKFYLSDERTRNIINEMKEEETE